MEPAPRPCLLVEPIFDRVVSLSGGQRIDATLDESPSWENADYVFREANVIAELKELQTDVNADRDLSERIGEIHYKHRERLGVLHGRQSVRIDLLPDDIRNEMIVPFQRRIEGPIKKAAKQIKETRAQLAMPDACGLLIIVNDASTFLNPQLAHFFFSRILSKNHRSIDHLVYCSVNMLLHTDDAPEGGCFWWDSPIPGRRSPPAGFLERLCVNWKRAIDEAVGVPGYDKHLAPEPPESLSMKFLPLPHGGRDSNFFVRPGRFYKDSALGFRYYCEGVSGGTARMLLVESYQQGKLLQAEFDQKLIYATRETYHEIVDDKEITRLKVMLKRMRRSQ